jgi:hypothetical protein
MIFYYDITLTKISSSISIILMAKVITKIVPPPMYQEPRVGRHQHSRINRHDVIILLSYFLFANDSSNKNSK